MSLGLVTVHENQWDAVRRNFQRLNSILLGTTSIPTFSGLTLTGLTANSLIYTPASKVLTSLGTATNGQIPIGSTGAVPVLAAITGTANQITSTPGAGSITLSLPSAVVIGHTDIGLAVLRLNNAVDACRLIWDVEGLGGAGHQSWGIQTDRAVNGDFAWLRGVVGSDNPGTLVWYCDPSGNIGIGKYAPGTLLDVAGAITATDLTLSAPVNFHLIAQKRHWVDVTAAPYFADNTGVTNAATAIQTAINAATAGSTIYLPRGTYKLESTITLPAYIGLIGDGHNAVSLSYTGTTIALTVNPTPAPIGYGADIGGFNMLGPPTVGSSIAIKAIDINRYRFQDILISRFATGINLHAQSYYCEQNTFDNIHFTGSGVGNSLKALFSFTNVTNGQDWDHNHFSNIWGDLANGSGANATNFLWIGSAFTGSVENITFENVVLFPSYAESSFIHSLNAAHTISRGRFYIRRATPVGYTTFRPFILETSGDSVAYSGYIDGGGTNSIVGGASISSFDAFDDLKIAGKVNCDWSPTSDAAKDLGAVGATDYRWRHLYLSGNLSDETNTLTIANAKAAYDHSQIAGGDSVHVSVTENSNWDAAYAHKSNNGTDHSFINQSVTTVASPSFARATIGGVDNTISLYLTGLNSSNAVLQFGTTGTGIYRIWGGDYQGELGLYTSAANAISFTTSGTTRLRVGGSGGIDFLGSVLSNPGNIVLPTVTGTKIGTATNQLLGFYGVIPVDQPATVADPSGGLVIDTEARTAIIAVIDRLQELGLVA